MHKQMPQLRMGGLSCGHNGALRRLDLPKSTPLSTTDKAILGLDLLTISAGIGPDQPTDHGFGQPALRRLGWIKHTEVEQAVGQSGQGPRHESRQQKNMSALPVHETILLNLSEDLDCDVGINKQDQS